ncbi:MAG: S4 domain-containing protein YaaA [Bacillaceae bacterium]|nr:S4 domain-containing protein YaaA [Bacillaceae bacterium]
MQNPTVEIDTEYITLGQLLKLADIVDSGGQVKHFLSETTVLVNGDPESRRGRKIYPDDRVKIEDVGEINIIRKS